MAQRGDYVPSRLSRMRRVRLGNAPACTRTLGDGNRIEKALPSPERYGTQYSTGGNMNRADIAFYALLVGGLTPPDPASMSSPAGLAAWLGVAA